MATLQELHSPENVLSLELLQCCTAELKMALFEFLGKSFDDLLEQRSMEGIKQLAVQSKTLAYIGKNNIV